MKTLSLFLVALALCFDGYSQNQKVFTEGTITYNVSSNLKTEGGGDDAFNGATLIVYMKGNDVRSDFQSPLMTQSIIFDAKEGTAVKLRESGQQKYITYFTAPQWLQYNHKYEGISFVYENDSKTIAGYTCKKAVGTLTDGEKITAYYSPDLVPFSPGYQYEFKNLPGLPLEYEVSNGKIVVKYSAGNIQFSPVNASRFDLPKSGYKVLDYKQ